MKIVPWLAVGAGVGVLVYLVLNAPEPKYATSSGTVEEGAAKAFGWGTKQRASGAGTDVIGKVKEGVGRFVGDPDLADEGAGDQVVGKVQNAVGQVAEAAGQTLHDLNI
jgi:uncharacterized protein YjbJ (UPF0337 family)